MFEGLKSAAALAVLFSLASCNPTELPAKGTRGASLTNTDGSLDGKAFVYKESPFILSGPNTRDTGVKIASYVDRTPAFITDNNKLSANCEMTFNYFNPFFAQYITYSDQVTDCIRQMGANTDTQPIARPADRTFMFPTGTSEFYQTNTLYHLQKAKDQFFKKLSFAYDNIHSIDYRTPKSVPAYLKDSKMYWFNGVTNTNSQILKNSYLNSYASCDSKTSAFFSPAGPQLCFGVDATRSDFRVVQDPSVIYHEFGHAMVSIMMNLRNGDGISTHPFRSNLGQLGYDEARALNEGIADYFSFVVNKRAHMGEWLGKISNQSRPMSEDDPKHIAALSTTPEGRLSYPQYLLYDPNFPDSPEETEHYAGSIVAHYLVAFTESLKTQCSLTSDADGGHDRATSYSMLLLAETLSELGDLNARGVDSNEFAAPYNQPLNEVFFNNLDFTNSFLWTQHVNQPSYRRFFQIWAKNSKKYISDNICTGFSKDESEKLLDDYGLLLFKTYNDNGNSSKSRLSYYEDVADLFPHRGVPPTEVSEDNRRNSVLVSKTLLNLAADVESDSSSDVNFYIIDNNADIKSLLQRILYKGFLLPLSNNVAGVEFNNSNIKISPGEVVALIPNLFNSSNTPMAGVQLLATDWDHVNVTSTATGNFKPCVVDGVTTVDQGAEAGSTCVDTPAVPYPDKDYTRLTKRCPTAAACTESQKVFPANAAAPVCMVQLDEGTSSKWVSQSEFRKKNGLSLLDKDCLGYSSSGNTEKDFTFNPHECLVRFLPGANEAFFSKIDAQKTYYDTVVKPSRLKRFNDGNLLIMEVNKWIPPGTKFRCRMRARFSNCSDCFTDGTNNDSDDYLDSDFNGHKPFKVINFEFNVND